MSFSLLQKKIKDDKVQNTRLTSLTQDSSGSEVDVIDEDLNLENPVVLLHTEISDGCWVGVKTIESYTSERGRRSTHTTARVGQVFRVNEAHCQIDVFGLNESGYWRKYKTVPNIPRKDLIVIKTPVPHKDPTDDCIMWKFPSRIIEYIKCYFSKEKQ